MGRISTRIKKTPKRYMVEEEETINLEEEETNLEDEDFEPERKLRKIKKEKIETKSKKKLIDLEEEETDSEDEDFEPKRKVRKVKKEKIETKSKKKTIDLEEEETDSEDEDIEPKRKVRKVKKEKIETKSKKGDVDKKKDPKSEDPEQQKDAEQKDEVIGAELKWEVKEEPISPKKEKVTPTKRKKSSLNGTSGVQSCSFCSKEFTHSRCKRHEKVCPKNPEGVVKSYSCHHCCRSFSRPDNLKQHIRTCSTPAESKKAKVACTYPGCDKKFNQVSILLEHISCAHEPIVFQVKTFENMAHFKKWKKEEERSTRCRFSQKYGKKNRKSIYLYCQHYGTDKPSHKKKTDVTTSTEEQPKKRPYKREHGRISIGLNCLSHMKVTTLENGEIQLTYNPNHNHPPSDNPYMDALLYTYESDEEEGGGEEGGVGETSQYCEAHVSEPEPDRDDAIDVDPEQDALNHSPQTTLPSNKSQVHVPGTNPPVDTERVPGTVHTSETNHISQQVTQAGQVSLSLEMPGLGPDHVYAVRVTETAYIEIKKRSILAKIQKLQTLINTDDINVLNKVDDDLETIFKHIEGMDVEITETNVEQTGKRKEDEIVPAQKNAVLGSLQLLPAGTANISIDNTTSCVVIEYVDATEGYSTEIAQATVVGESSTQ